MTLALVLASAIGVIWAWIVWIVVGGIAGAIADKIIQGNKLGIVGNILVGVIGGLIGGLILGLFGFDGQGIIWTFITSFLGACLLLGIIGLVTHGRGIGNRRPR